MCCFGVLVVVLFVDLLIFGWGGFVVGLLFVCRFGFEFCWCLACVLVLVDGLFVAAAECLVECLVDCYWLVTFV